MEKSVHSRILNFFVVALALCLNFFAACEIGLGASVDTEPPEITILSPSVDSVVRGTFAIKGTWTDDGIIASAKATLKRTDGFGTAIEYDADWTGTKNEGDWTVIIDPSLAAKPVLDGSYEVTLTFTDEGDHKVTQSRTFSIDNTAPLIVLQRPGTKLTETPDAYGQTFSLNGMGADDNSIDHISVNIYSDPECTQLIKTITKSNVAPTIELDVAVFEDGVENDYAAIYGSTTKNGVQNRYCSITAYDNAKRYPVEGDRTTEDDIGNSTSFYYLYDDIYNGVLSDYTVTEVYKMLSGTYLLADSNRSADTVTSVKSILNQNTMSKSNFSLNPENNPLFIVNGKDVLTKSGNDFSGDDYNISNGTGIVIEVSTGLDGISLNASSLRPYLLPCDAYGNASIANTPENRIYLAQAGTGAKSGTSYKFTVTIDSTQTYPNNKTLVIGNSYIFGVEGSDQRGNTVIPKGGAFGFKLASNGAAPGLTVTSPSTTIAYVKAGGSQVFSGIVTCQEGCPTIAIRNGDNTVWSHTFTASEAIPSNGVLRYDFEHTINYDPAAENAQIQYTVEATQNGLKTTAFKTVIYDKDAPEVSVGSILPIASKYDTANENTVALDGQYLNGTVTLKLSVNDTYDAIDTLTEGKTPYFEILDAANNTPISLKVNAETVASTTHPITTLINGSYTIDTTQIQTGNTDRAIRIKIYAWDRAGNSTVYTYSGTTTSEESVLKVNQVTDEPVILPTNSDMSLTYASKAERDDAVTQGNRRKSQLPSGGQLLLSIIDDDGISEYKIYEVALASADESATHANTRFSNNVAAVDGGGSTQLTVPKVVPTAAGYYWYKVWAKDINGLEKTVGPFIIKVTTQAPSITVSAVDSDSEVSGVGVFVGGTASEKKIWKNKIEIDSSEDSFVVYRAINPSDPTDLSNYAVVGNYNETTKSGIKTDTNNPKIKYDFINIENTSIFQNGISGNQTIYYYVEDTANNNDSTIKNIECKYDGTAPVLSITSPGTGDNAKTGINAINSSPYQFRGSITEDNSISALYYKVVAASADAPAAPAANITSSASWTGNGANGGWTSVSPEANWSFYRDIGSAAGAIVEGKYKIYMYALDGAGNLSDSDPATAGAQPRSCEFHVDMAAPVVTATAPVYVNHSTNTNNSRKVTISGSITETHGLESFTINGADNLSRVQNDLSWSYEDTPAADGTYTYTIVATDKVGKTNTNLTKTVTVDTARPTVNNDQTKFTTPTNVQTESSMFKFEGAADSVRDSSPSTGFDKVEIAFTNDSTAPAGAQATVTPAANGSWESTVEFANSAYTGVFTDAQGAHIQGPKNLWVKVYDKAGNSSDWTLAKSFVYDKAEPVINSVTVKKGAAVLTSSYTNGGITFEVEATDTYAIQNVKIARAQTFTAQPSDWTGGGYYTDAACNTAAATFSVNTTYYTSLGTAGLSSGKYTKAFRVGQESGTSTLLADGVYNFVITATDLSGKTKSVNKTITVDTTIPTGTFNSSAYSPQGIDVTKDSVTNKWYKSSSIRFSVNVTDANISTVEISKDNTEFETMNPGENNAFTGTITGLKDGLNTIYLRMTDHAGNTNNSATTTTSVFVDSAAPASLTAYDSDGNLINGSLLTNQSSSKDVFIAVEDDCIRGKKITAATAPSDWVTNYTNYYTDEDLTTPISATEVYIANTYYEKDTSTVTGIDTVTFGTIDGELQTSGNNNGRYKITIPATSQSGNINVTVKDKVGNEARLLAFRFESDITPPAVSISTPSASTLYGTKTITGNVTEINPKSVSLYYRRTAPSADTAPDETDSGWTLIKKITKDSGTDTATVKYNAIDSEIYSWTVSNVNFNTLSGAAATADSYTKPLYFLVYAEDKAGNNSVISTPYYTKNYTVDLDADRPVIQFTNGLSLGTSMAAVSRKNLSDRNLNGNVTDDEGITLLEYKSDIISGQDYVAAPSDWGTVTYYTTNACTTSAPATFTAGTYYKKTAGTYTEVPLTGSSFSISLSDGAQNISFRVTSNGNTFETSETDSFNLSSPKIKDGAASPATYGYSNSTKKATSLFVIVDTQKPSVSSIEYSLTPDVSTSWSNASRTFGGTNAKNFYIRQFAYDANGIVESQTGDSIKNGDYGTRLKIEKNSDDESTGTNRVTGFTSSDDTYYYYTLNKVVNSTRQIAGSPGTEWRSDVINSLGMKSGNRNAVFEICDGTSSKETEFILVIDNTAPVIDVSQPDSSQYSSGNIVAYGETDLTDWRNTSTTDNPKEFMYYALTLDTTTNPAADYASRASATAITSWQDEDGNTLTTNPAGGNATIAYKPYYTPIVGGGFNWYVYFDDGTTGTYTHAPTFKKFLIDSGITTQAAIESTNSNQKFITIVKAYLWIKAVDEVGNETIEKHPVLIDPQGDAPSVTIDYPEENGAILGGTVTLRGTATDTIGTNVGVDSVWIQIISAKYNGYNSASVTSTTGKECGGLEFTDTVTSTTNDDNSVTYSHAYTLNSFTPKIKDVRQWISNHPNSVYTNISTIDNPNTTEVEGPTLVTSVTGDDDDDAAEYYIQANFAGSAWNLKINNNGEYDPDAGKLNPIAYRVFAKDRDGYLSRYQQQLSVYDSDNPIVSGVYLRQYDESNNVIASRPYEDNMWVKGNWWLYGTVKDTNGIASIKIKPRGGTETVLNIAGGQINGNDNIDEHFNYQLSTGTGVGSLSIEVTATDKVEQGARPHETVRTYEINYDNIDPVPVTSGTNYNISDTVQNSHGFYSFSSQVTEDNVGINAQSGFDYLAFWFEREITGTNAKHVVYDVMRDKGNSEVQWNAFGENPSEENGLMWKTKTVTRNKDTPGTLTLSAADPNIHASGLCKIGGSIYFISSVNGTTIIINGQPEYRATTNTVSETVKFAIANVVNNNVESGTGIKSTTDGMYGYYSSISNDDGDHMIESVSKQGTTWTWEANINSQNMKDGTIKLHYVVFDKAGNYAAREVQGSVANNAPRIASLEVWSDFNENGGNPEPGESNIKYFNANERKLGNSHVMRATAVTSEFVVSGNDKDYTLAEGETVYGSAFMTVKATTTFIPELVGGNGALYYTYKYGDKEHLGTADVHYGAATIGNGNDDGIDEDVNGSGYYRADENGSAYILGNDSYEMVIYGGEGDSTTDDNSYTLYALNNSASATDPTWFEYTIYDSTEGSGAWSGDDRTDGRLSAKFRVALNVQYRDSTSPVVKIRPFYWNSLTENSVDKPSNPSSFADLRGHIELEGDLPTSFTAGGSGVNDRDPKVSGVIKIEGYAFDDIKLKELWVKMSGHTILQGGIKVADYTPTAATKWTTVGHEADAGWDFTATDVYCNADGHLVKWTLTVDTAKRDTPAQTEQTVVVYAVDARGSDTTKTSAHSGTTQTTLTSYRWGTVKNQENSEKLYYEDIYFYKNASKTDTSDNAMVYKVDTWGSVNNEENAYTTYYTDFYGSTHPTNATPDATIVYKNPMSYYYKMDIVPYITKVETGLSKHKSSNWSVYNRTALGHYPVQSVVTNAGDGINLKTTTSENVTLYGFNLNHSSATFTSGSSNFTTTATDNLKITNSIDTETQLDKLSFNVASLQTGKLNLTVNGIPLMNNSNKNDAKGTANEAGNSNANYYNLQPNGDTNNIQNDDVEFDVWEFNDRAAVPINGLATGINMEVNQKTGMLNYAFANGGLYFSMGGNTIRSTAYSNNNSYSSIYWVGDYDTFAGPCVGFHVDELGYTYSVDSGGDTNTQGSVDKWDLWTSRWGQGRRGYRGTLNDDGEDVNTFRALRLEEIGLKTGTDAMDYSLMKYRFLSPEFASTVDTTENSTNLYLVYYDALCNQIRFRAGTFSGTNRYQQTGGFQDQYIGGASSYYNINNCQVIANGDSDPFTVNGGTVTVPSISGRGAGQYVDVAVVKNDAGKDVVCVVWFDSVSNCCKFSYITDPITNWENLKGNATARNWSTPKTIFAEGGEYCHIVADKNNHLHIAAYAGNGDVMYSYLAAYSSLDAAGAVASTCVVDASGTVGEHLTLDVAVAGTGANAHSIPYIGYFTSAIKMPKYAYLVDKTTGFSQTAAGVDLDERFTGNWEVTVVPSPSRMTTNREDKVNIGVWKNSGVLKNSTTGTSTRGGQLNGYDSTNWSKTFGNGTANAVLGYQIATSTGSCLETAQKR